MLLSEFKSNTMSSLEPTHSTENNRTFVDYPIITASHLCKQVGTGNNEIKILNDLHIEVAQGESVAIVGSSGSGKSTLLALLAGLDIPSSGEVKVSGHAFSELNEDDRAAIRGAQMGFVFQSFQLLPTMTALENVMLPMQLTHQKEARHRAIETLEKVDLKDRMHHYPRQLSGGEQQRVAIARAFAPRPSILFADEPTGNLDAATGDRIIELLFNLNQQANTTLILVTHDNHLAKRCDRTLRLQHGQLHAL